MKMHTPCMSLGVSLHLLKIYSCECVYSHTQGFPSMTRVERKIFHAKVITTLKDVTGRPHWIDSHSWQKSSKKKKKFFLNAKNYHIMIAEMETGVNQ